MLQMPSLLQRKLIVVTGKGGVGKTTITAALGLLAARRGLRTIMVEVGDQHRLPALLGASVEGEHGVEVDLSAHTDLGGQADNDGGLWSLTIDPDRVLTHWLGKLGGRISARVLGSSSTFQYFVAAAPGAREMLSMVEVWNLTQDKRGRSNQDYDLVLLDAPATGHALAMLRSPRTFAAIARVGPLAGQAQRVRELLLDPARSGYVAVALGSEMAVTETLELQDGLREELERELDAMLVNGMLPKRFDGEELARIEEAGADGNGALASMAARAARAAYERGRTQQNQLARLRRRQTGTDSAPRVLGVPFVFEAELGLAAVGQIADLLERKL
jgi:anion-transporting  ArsA/GET3 family ATPase